MGAVFNLSFLEINDFFDFVSFLNLKKIKTYAATLNKNSKTAEDLKKERGVLILGNEANGLPSSIVKNSYKEVKIKISSSFESLNVLVAGSILMYEMSKNNENLS